jgi:tRNA(Arg) A34 adenosine deaminase TadA
MKMAIEVCRAGVAAGQTPFGACIVSAAGQVLACEHNRVWQSTDPTAHAEVQAIRVACGKLGQVHLEGATIYSTTEPCPMCFSAIHWARMARIVYAAGIADAADFGFNELRVSNADLKRLGQLSVELAPGVLRDDAVAVYQQWRAGGGRVY